MKVKNESQQIQDRSRSQTVQRACKVLDYLACSEGSATVGEIAAAVGIHRTAVRRMLVSLSDEGLIERQNNAYVLGAHVLRLGRAYLDQLGIQSRALPYLLGLRETVLKGGERTVALAVPSGAEIIIVDRIYGRAASLATIVDAGTSFPIAATAMGRCILAQWEESSVVALLGAERADELLPRLVEIRERSGVEFSRSPYEAIRPGIDSVAVPINAGNRTFASLCLFGTDLGHDLDIDSPVCLELRRSAEGLSASETVARFTPARPRNRGRSD
jgi:DNA-binding IclR family transcriptional regulator